MRVRRGARAAVRSPGARSPVARSPVARSAVARSPVALGVVALVLLAGCGSGSDGRRPSASTPTGASASASTPTGASASASSPAATSAPPSTASASPAGTQPLALAYDVHRPPLDLTRAEAQRLVAGTPTTWRALGQAGGAVGVRRDGAAALRAAARDDRVLAVLPAGQLTPTVRRATVDGVDPLRDPARYPLTAPADGPAPVVTTVTVGGDLMLGRRVASSGAAGSALRFLARDLASADITVGNLESTLSRAGRPRQGGDSFAASPAVVPELEAAGFDVLSLANNHSGDYGPGAFAATMRTLDRSRIARVGAGRDVAEAWRPTVVERGGLRFGFVAFNAIGETPRATNTRAGAAEVRMPPRTGPLNPADVERLTSTIRSLKARGDVVVVLPHWGTQYTNVPVPAQRRVADAMVAAGADVVVGGHPHWVQGVQWQAGVPIVHSLGNLVFDMDFSRPTQEGVLAQLVFWDGRLRGLDLVPYVIGAGFAPRLVSGAPAQRILARVWSASDPPWRG